MDLVILAGGAGTRLAPPHPKPLVRLLGLTLLERVAWQAWKACAPKRILIVGGYQFHRLQRELPSLHLPPASIHLIHNPHWEKGNGTSVLAVQPWMKDEPFLVTMVDHLLPAFVYSQLATLPLSEEQTMVVAVDPHPPEYVDLDDASKVQMMREHSSTCPPDVKTSLLPRVRQIGKTLTQWDAIDVGVFRLHPSLFPYLKQELEIQGRCTLLGALQRYIREGGVLRAWSIRDNPAVRPAQPPKHVYWVDIDTPEMLHVAERLLLQSLTKPTDGPIARWINRPLSRWITRYLVSLPITPNHITVFAFFLAVGAALLIAIPRWLTLAIGGTLAQIASIIDGCDGEIARLKFLESERGAWLDAVLDRYADAFLISALALHLAGTTASTSGTVPINVLLWLILALSGVLINSYTADKYDAYLKRALTKNLSRLPLRLGRDVRIFLLWIGALFNLPLYTLAILGILNHGEVIRRIGVLFFWQKA